MCVYLSFGTTMLLASLRRSLRCSSKLWRPYSMALKRARALAVKPCSMSYIHRFGPGSFLYYISHILRRSRVRGPRTGTKIHPDLLDPEAVSCFSCAGRPTIPISLAGDQGGCPGEVGGDQAHHASPRRRTHTEGRGGEGGGGTTGDGGVIPPCEGGMLRDGWGGDDAVGGRGLGPVLFRRHRWCLEEESACLLECGALMFSLIVREHVGRLP